MGSSEELREQTIAEVDKQRIPGKDKLAEISEVILSPLHVRCNLISATLKVNASKFPELRLGLQLHFRVSVRICCRNLRPVSKVSSYWLQAAD